MSCIATPISWLRLERHALGELAGEDARAIEAHLAACAACRACAERVSAPAPALRALPAAAPPRRAWGLRFAWVGALAAAAAALLVIVILRPAPSSPSSTPRIRIKGGVELVVTAVRERSGQLTHAPTTFAPGDRFKLAVTCSTPTPVIAEVVVFQHGAPAFPLSAARITCGNEVVLPGAFVITTPTLALACVAVDVDRDEVTPRHPAVACVPLAPE